MLRRMMMSMVFAVVGTVQGHAASVTAEGSLGLFQIYYNGVPDPLDRTTGRTASGSLLVTGGDLISATASVSGTGGDTALAEGVLEITHTSDFNSTNPATIGLVFDGSYGLDLAKDFGEPSIQGGVRLGISVDVGGGYLEVRRAELYDGPFDPSSINSNNNISTWTFCENLGDSCVYQAGESFPIGPPRLPTFMLAIGDRARVDYSVFAVAVAPVPLPASAPMAIAAFAALIAAGHAARRGRSA